MRTTASRPSTKQRAAAAAALFAAYLTAIPMIAAAQAAQDITVEVTGTGANGSDARMDAMRQALQQVIPQLVFADREIRNDEVVKDQIMSSLTGHIKGAKLLDQKSAGGQVQASYAITVSPKEIENFVHHRSTNNGARSSIDGAALFGEIQRETEARVFREAYIRRLISGYPVGIVQTAVEGVKPTDRLNVVEVDVRYRLDPAWVRSMKAGLSQIACQSKVAGDDYSWRIENAANCGVPVCFGPRVGINGYPNVGVTGWSQCIVPAKGTKGGTRAEVGSTDHSALDLLLGLGLNGGSVSDPARAMFAAVFKDAENKNVGRMFCLRHQPLLGGGEAYMSTSNTRKVLALNGEEFKDKYWIDLKRIDLAQMDKVARLQLLPVFVSETGLWVDVASDQPAGKPVCDITF